MKNQEHLTEEGLSKIRKIKAGMNACFAAEDDTKEEQELYFLICRINLIRFLI